MRFGIIAFPTDRAALTETAVLSEQLGYEALYAPDHLCAFWANESRFEMGLSRPSDEWCR